MDNGLYSVEKNQFNDIMKSINGAKSIDILSTSKTRSFNIDFFYSKEFEMEEGWGREDDVFDKLHPATRIHVVEVSVLLSYPLTDVQLTCR